MSLEKRLVFVLIGDEQNNSVTYFADRAQWKPGINGAGP